MRIRAIAVASLLMATAMSYCLPAHAFTSGVWEGKPSFDENGKLSDCTMTAQSDNGILLAFIISRDFDWGLVLYDDGWKLKVGDSTDVALTVDKNAPIFSTAKTVDPHGILVPLANTDPVVDAMREGNVLTVATDRRQVQLQIDRRRRPAIADLAGCVTENLEAEKLLGHKMDTAAPSRSRPEQALHRDRGSRISSPTCSRPPGSPITSWSIRPRIPCPISTWCGPTPTASSRRWSATRI